MGVALRLRVQDFEFRIEAQRLLRVEDLVGMGKHSGYIGIVEKKMETTIGKKGLYRVIWGDMGLYKVIKVLRIWPLALGFPAPASECATMLQEESNPES